MKIKRWICAFLCALLCVGLIPANVFAQDSIDTWDGTFDTSWYSSESTEFHITTAEQLAGLAKLVNNDVTFAGATVYLDSDLDLSGHEWVSIGDGSNTLDGSFQDIFEGGRHTIYNLYSHAGVFTPGNTPENEENNLYRCGLFGCINNAEIHNLGIENADIIMPDEDHSTYGKGIIVDWMNNSTITGCYTTGSITGNGYLEKYIGGIAGFLCGNNTVSGCYSTAHITGNYDGSGYEDPAVAAGFWDALGGIVGASYSGIVTISDCWFDGKITVNSIQAPVGGIIGFTSGVTIKNCMVTTSDLESDEYGNTLWLGYTADYTDAQNCFWPADDKYIASLSNYMNGTSAGRGIQDFREASVLTGLQANAAEGVVWVSGMEHPTFEWDDNNILADYTAINEAIERAESFDAQLYSNYDDVTAAVDAVDFKMSKAQQAELDAAAQAINDAVDALEYKPADYTAVDAAIAKVDSLNPDDYTDFSAVEAAVNAVVRDKNITEQAAVDAMAKAIEGAVSALEMKETQNDTGTAAETQGAQSGETSPYTGTNFSFALWFAMLAASAAAVCAFVLCGKKRRGAK